MVETARADAVFEPRTGREPVELLIFDCDGVLIDSEIVVCRLTAEELSRLGYAVSTEEVIERFAGRPEYAMIAEIERHWGRAVPAAYFPAIRSRIDAAYATELRIMPGIASLVRRIGVDFCVASSSYPAKLALGLRSVGLYESFAPNVLSATAVAHGKPAPDIFIYAAGWMRRPVARCVVIEDSVPGVRAARAAGMRAIGFVGGGHVRAGHAERLLEAGAERVVGAFEELDAVLPEAFR